MNIKKIATNDAESWARAEMFFGEGAGTRRKLLNAEIAHKVERISGYHEAFNKAYSKQNMADHAIKAAKERKHLDRSNIIRKNVGALLRGDRRGMSNAFAAVVIVAAVSKATGYDKVAIEKAKKLKDDAQRRWVLYKSRRALKDYRG